MEYNEDLHLIFILCADVQQRHGPPATKDNLGPRGAWLLYGKPLQHILARVRHSCGLKATCSSIPIYLAWYRGIFYFMRVRPCVNKNCARVFSLFYGFFLKQ
jgi:hypothetical protein